MFRLSKAAEYATRGVLYLSEQSGKENTGIEEIAKAQNVPPAYLAKLFQVLARKGFVRSMRGHDGGFRLLKRPQDISFLDVIEAVEGPIFLNDCLIHEGYCPNDQVCPIHDTWKEAQDRLLDFLKSCDFKQLALAGEIKRKQTAGVPKSRPHHNK
jgi:Rrf2 family protein